MVIPFKRVLLSSSVTGSKILVNCLDKTLQDPLKEDILTAYHFHVRRVAKTLGQFSNMNVANKEIARIVGPPPKSLE